MKIINLDLIKKNRFFYEMLFLLIFSLLMSKYIGFARVSGTSMQPSIRNNNFLLVNNNFSTNKIKRGDIIIAKSPDGTIIVKRVIGLPNENIKVDENGHVLINEKFLKEDYLNKFKPPYGDRIPDFFDNNHIIISEKTPDNSVFIMGDNRGNSVDSRSHGPIKLSDVIGKVIFKI